MADWTELNWAKGNYQYGRYRIEKLSNGDYRLFKIGDRGREIYLMRDKSLGLLKGVVDELEKNHMAANSTSIQKVMDKRAKQHLTKLREGSEMKGAKEEVIAYFSTAEKLKPGMKCYVDGELLEVEEAVPSEKSQYQTQVTFKGRDPKHVGNQFLYEQDKNYFGAEESVDSDSFMPDEEWIQVVNTIDIGDVSSWPDRKIQAIFGDDSFWSESEQDVMLGDQSWDGILRRNGREVAFFDEVDGKVKPIGEKKAVEKPLEDKYKLQSGHKEEGEAAGFTVVAGIGAEHWTKTTSSGTIELTIYPDGDATLELDGSYIGERYIPVDEAIRKAKELAR